MYRKLLIVLLALLLGTSALAEATAAPTEAPAIADATEAPASPDAEPTEVPADAEPTEALADPEATPQPAKGYVWVSTSTRQGFLPLPEEGEYSYHLQQVLPDGTLAENVIHVTPDGVWMEDSTCENHDCINQGHVTLDNRRDRVLGGMIICLPNQVYLELMTPEEIRERAQSQQE